MKRLSWRTIKELSESGLILLQRQQTKMTGAMNFS